MPLPKTLHAYTDVPLVLDPIILAGGGTYTLPTAKEAARWAQRAYRYRVLLRDDMRNRSRLRNVIPQTPYDGITITRNENVLTITTTMKVTGTVTLATGESFAPGDMPKPRPPEDVGILDEAALELLRLHEDDK